MTPEERNPLDLNNLPGDDYSSRDHGKQLLDDTSSSAGAGAVAGGGYRKKKSGGSKDDGKVYECRFCSLKFCKSQALGGHMNRHRQERETETLNRARQLVFTNDNLIIPPPTPPHHLVSGQPIPHGGYHHHQTGDHFRSIYSASRLFSGSSSSTIIPPPPPPPQMPQSYMYTSPSRLVPYPPSHYNNNQQVPINDYFVGHVLPGSNNTQYPNYTATAPAPPESNYTCIGAPVGHGFGHGRRGDINNNDEEINGLNLNMNRGNRSYAAAAGTTQQQRLDPSSMINRYQDGF